MATDRHGLVQIVPPGRRAVISLRSLSVVAGISALVMVAVIAIAHLVGAWLYWVAGAWVVASFVLVWTVTNWTFPGRLRRVPELTRQDRRHLDRVARDSAEVTELVADPGHGTRLLLTVRSHLLQNGGSVLAYARTAQHARSYTSLGLRQIYPGYGLMWRGGASLNRVISTPGHLQPEAHP